MQPTPVDAVLFPDRPVVRLSDALRRQLVALAAGAEAYVDDLEGVLDLHELRASGLVTYQSPLLGPLLQAGPYPIGPT